MDSEDSILPYRDYRITSDNGDDLAVDVHVESVNGADMSGGVRRQLEDEDIVLIEFSAPFNTVTNSTAYKYTHGMCSVATGSCVFAPDTNSTIDRAGRRLWWIRAIFRKIGLLLMR